MMTDTARFAAFETFVREYQDMVYATAIRLLSNPAEAEDVAQTVFLKAFERFADVGTSPAAAGWLKTVTTNLCLNHLSRYRSRWRFFSELEPSGAAGGHDVGTRDHVDGLMARAGVQVTAAQDAELDAADEQARLEQALRRCRITSGCRSSSFTSRTRATSRLPRCSTSRSPRSRPTFIVAARL